MVDAGKLHPDSWAQSRAVVKFCVPYSVLSVAPSSSLNKSAPPHIWDSWQGYYGNATSKYNDFHDDSVLHTKGRDLKVDNEENLRSLISKYNIDYNDLNDHSMHFLPSYCNIQ